MSRELEGDLDRLKDELFKMEQQLGAMDSQEKQLHHQIDHLHDQIETEPLADEGRALQARIQTLLAKEP